MALPNREVVSYTKIVKGCPLEIEEVPFKNRVQYMRIRRSFGDGLIV